MDHRPIAGQVPVRHGDAHAMRAYLHSVDRSKIPEYQRERFLSLLACVEQMEDSVSDRFRDASNKRSAA